MKKWFLSLLLLGTVSVNAQTVISPAQDVVKKLSERPSCEMLGWRWVKTLSRLKEKDLVLKDIEQTGDYRSLAILAERVPGESPEGLAPQVERRLVFKVPGANLENSRVVRIDTPAVVWENITENSTDLISIQILNGKVMVDAPTSYLDYCFYQKASKIEMEVKGKKVVLRWHTLGKNLDSYLRLLK